MTSFLLMLSVAFCLLTAGASGQSVRFAVIGDFGVDDANELAVANLVKTNLRPDFIVTVGDNHYNGATASTVTSESSGKPFFRLKKP